MTDEGTGKVINRYTCFIKGCHEVIGKQLKHVCDVCNFYFCESHLHWLDKQICSDCLDDIMKDERHDD